MPSDQRAQLEVFANLAHSHREHEKFYASAPHEVVLSLLRASRALKALAERWETTRPRSVCGGVPFAGAEDLNDDRATETMGILFMEDGKPPSEIEALRADLERRAADAEATGRWLSQAMDASWAALGALADHPRLVDLLGERHSIVSNDWQAAALLQVVAHQLRRAGEVLDRVDFSAGALRADLGGPRHVVAYAWAAAELIDQAADLLARSALLVHRNERKWRLFGERVDRLLDVDAETPPPVLAPASDAPR